MEKIGVKGKDVMDGAMVIKRIYEKDGIIHIDAFQPRGIKQFTHRLTIAKTGDTIVDGRTKN